MNFKKIKDLFVGGKLSDPDPVDLFPDPLEKKDGPPKFDTFVPVSEQDEGLFEDYTCDIKAEYKLRGYPVYFTHFKSKPGAAHKDEYVMMTNLIKKTKDKGSVVLNQEEVDSFWKQHFARGLSEGTMSLLQFESSYKKDCDPIPFSDGIYFADDDFSTQHMKIIREE